MPLWNLPSYLPFSLGTSFWNNWCSCLQESRHAGCNPSYTAEIGLGGCMGWWLPVIHIAWGCHPCCCLYNTRDPSVPTLAAEQVWTCSHALPTLLIIYGSPKCLLVFLVFVVLCSCQLCSIFLSSYLLLWSLIAWSGNVMNLSLRSSHNSFSRWLKLLAEKILDM
jgi:hypothetical protein